MIHLESDKEVLRAEIRRRKRETTEGERRVWSGHLCGRVMAMPRWQTARTVMLYQAMSDEVDLQPLVEAAWQTGKRVLMPVVKGAEMAVRLVDAQTPHRLSAYGIREPQGEDFTAYETIDLILVPGMAFDAEGHRLGRGKGYYDRFLPLCKRAWTLGVCFPFQRVDSVPVDAMDQPVHEVL
ncbi:MAG: 5-formyltetrahydrofolate cyclo-ligase [Bacteroidaceae bacterium]|nr:5-formyltetrahydrofolate cyclo-ligase [Bacteroidaceae bacterium]